MNRLVLVLSAMVLAMYLHGQWLTWRLNSSLVNDHTQNLFTTVDTYKGSKTLLNYSPRAMYVHLGAVKNLNNGEWKQPDKLIWDNYT